jgi:hypothetical protein
MHIRTSATSASIHLTPSQATFHLNLTVHTSSYHAIPALQTTPSSLKTLPEPMSSTPAT